MTWKLLPQEQAGIFKFRGIPFLTRGVESLLKRGELDEILDQLEELIEQKRGVFYKQIFENEIGDRVVCFDNSFEAIFRCFPELNTAYKDRMHELKGSHTLLLLAEYDQIQEERKQ